MKISHQNSKRTKKEKRRKLNKEEELTVDSDLDLTTSCTKTKRKQIIRNRTRSGEGRTVRGKTINYPSETIEIREVEEKSEDNRKEVKIIGPSVIYI